MNVSAENINHIKRQGVFALPEHHSFFLKGEDVRRWCNGMFSNNIRRLKPNKGNRSGICNPKAHIQGFLDIFCIDDNCFLVILDGISEEEFTKKFAPFMMLDDIELESISDHIVSLQGDSAEEVLAKAGWSIEKDQDMIQTDWGYIVRKDRFGSRRQSHGFDLISKDPTLLEKNLIEQGAISIDTPVRDAYRILSLYPSFQNEVGRKTFFHELGVNEECCAFTKGCYVGQEIINRMDVKGILGKKLQLYRCESQLEIGMECKDGKRSVGQLSSVCQVDGLWYGMGLIRKSAWGKALQIDSLILEHIPIEKNQ